MYWILILLVISVSHILASVSNQAANSCSQKEFLCDDGGCVPASLVCDDNKDCADGGDEATCDVSFRCLDSSEIPAVSQCDGTKDCADGSDETAKSCILKTCTPTQFQCAYGACVNSDAKCNGIFECADGSDEVPALCRMCVLPPYPAHGKYHTMIPDGRPGKAFDFVSINVTCYQGYTLVGSQIVYCTNSRWSETMPRCVSQCQLDPNQSVTYECFVSDNEDTFRTCNEYEPSGTVVRPRCQSPSYYSRTTLELMHCIDGSWDYIARCKLECGRVSLDETVVYGAAAKRGEIPWHAGIYTKTMEPYMQICGGSLISTAIVISAAHCFWSAIEGPIPASKYAVAVGKIYRPWNNPKEAEMAQTSDVKEVHLPNRFQGSAANYQDDIAVVVVSVAFEYDAYTHPVCLDFDFMFEKKQLQPGELGKVAGWGLTSKNGKHSPVLMTAELPYVSIDNCISDTPHHFLPFITSDKFCAGVKDGTMALCKGDSGGGLAFQAMEGGIAQFYLRGVVSTAPNTDDLCNLNTYSYLTRVTKHERFIKQYWTINM